MTTPGRCRRCELVEVELVDGRFTPVEGTERTIPAQLVLLAMGFTGPQRAGLVEQLGVELDPRGNVARDADFMSSVPGVFVAGDAGRGQSLIVWAIAEGRAAAAGVDAWLRDAPSTLPATDPAHRAAGQRLTRHTSPIGIRLLQVFSGARQSVTNAGIPPSGDTSRGT